MSSFCGKMREYSTISIDRFDGINLNSYAYFLSHCHSDHTQGLDSPLFYHRLQSNCNIFIYCSEVTKILLENNKKFNCLKKYIKILSIDESTTIIIPNNANSQSEIILTALSAGHCPGSTMFLFEGREGTVLYTGDFRLNNGDVKKLNALHINGCIKDIKSIYIDTTFCIPTANHFPTRQESCEKLIQIIEEWLKISNSHVVRLICKTQCGYEYLLFEIWKCLKIKVHVNLRTFSQYCNISNIQDCLTLDDFETPIHACSWKENMYNSEKQLPCKYIHPEGVKLKILLIKPSVMWYTHYSRSNNLIEKSGNFVRLCYSMHSSYEEIRDFVNYIKPRKIYPNVIPINSSYDEVYSRLKDLLNIPEQVNTLYCPSQEFKLLKCRKRSYYTSNVCDSQNESLLGKKKINDLDSSQNSFCSSTTTETSSSEGLDLCSSENSDSYIDLEDKENTNNHSVKKILQDKNESENICLENSVVKMNCFGDILSQTHEFVSSSQKISDIIDVKEESSVDQSEDELSSSPSLLSSFFKVNSSFNQNAGPKKVIEIIDLESNDEEIIILN